MPAITVPARIVRRINAEFDQRHPELLSRLSRIAHRFRDEEEVLAELQGFAYLNSRSVVLRRGEFLNPSQMAFMAWKRALSGRTIARNTSGDVHGPIARRLHHIHIISLSQLSEARHNLALNDRAVDRIVTALTTSEKEQPDVRAATRLDWAAFMRTLPNRLRRILRGLVIGDSKGLIARRLGISGGHLSQLLDVLAREVQAFFGPEVLPGWRAA